MKSNEETRKRFKERITEALGVVSDSDELTEALGIVEDLDELVEIQAVTAEYFYHSNLSRVEDYDYDDYDDYGSVHDGVNVKKLKEYVVHRMDLFLGLGVHGGLWKNSQHWIAVQVDKLRQAAENAGMPFMQNKIKRPAAPASSNPFVVSHPRIGQINLTPQTPPKPAAPVSQYLDEMKDIVNKLTSGNPSLVTVTLKTCGDFEMKYGGHTAYLCHSYVPRTVTIKDSGRKKVRTFKETDIDGIVQCLKGVLH